ncbi:MFS transporter [Sporomusaceae bacterium FL31]|nr:MFS transporter [Sporomusaceae bacterium FL31]GCE35513.1 MFS transporter [Sporomusaceae bacterium]
MEHALDQAPNKYMVLLTVSLGTILSGYVSSSVDIALPNIMNTFGFTMDSVVWVMLSYMIPYGATLPIMGKLGDQYGRKKMYIIGLMVFTVATMLVGLSWSSSTVILFRVIQGIGAGLLFPNAMALVADAFPPNERGQALGMWGAFAAAGSTLGPTIGGYIVEYVSWRVLFSSIVPISVVGLFLALTVLKESTLNAAAKIDYLGGGLLVLSLSTLLIALNQGAKEGWTSIYIVGLFTMMTLAMAGFIYIESHIKHPLVDLNLFKDSTFTVSNVVGFLSFMALYGGLFLLPFFMRNILGYTPIRSGMSLFPLVGSMILMAPLGGKIADKSGAKIPATVGMVILTMVLYSFHTITDQTAYFPIAIRLVFMGIGLALTMSPVSNGALATLPKDKIGVGSGVFNLFKNIGGSVGIAIMGTLLDSRQIFHHNRLSEHLTTSSDIAQSTVAALQSGFAQSGLPFEQAKLAAYSILNSLIAKQAAVQAFEDVFMVTAALSALGILAALLIKDAKGLKKVPADKPASEDINQEDGSNMEACAPGISS